MMIGYNAQLKIHVESVDHKTRPTELFYSAPYKLMNYFEMSQGGIEYIIMNASAGIMSGDHYDMDVRVGERARLTLSPQSFEKIHKMHSGDAVRKARIFIGKNSYFKYIPLPTIPFADSAFKSITKIELADSSSKLLYSDIVSCGRLAQEERFLFSHYESCIDIHLSNQLLCRDHCVFIPTENPMESYGLFEGYNYLGNLFIYGFFLTESMNNHIVSRLHDADMEAGITALLGGGYLIRVFSHTSETLIHLLSEILTFIGGENQCPKN